MLRLIGKHDNCIVTPQSNCIKLENIYRDILIPLNIIQFNIEMKTYSTITALIIYRMCRDVKRNLPGVK